jgi:flavorubredoxin
MRPVEIKPNIWSIAVNDRTTDLFEGLWPVTNEGVSYNSYIIKDEKSVLIDLTKDIFSEEFVDQIAKIVDLKTLDYVIVNHVEPDHTGALTRFREIAPNVTFIGTRQCINMMNDFYGMSENTMTVKDGDTLNLGKFNLKFLTAPMVHWPETMFTYLEEEQILFSCDAFGTFGCLDGITFDDEAGDNLPWYEKESLRYYSNIIASFSRNVLNAIEKAAAFPIQIIAPSHGLIWRKDPMRIVSLYKKFAEYAAGPTEPGVTILWGTMYRNTERAMEAVLQTITAEGVPVEVYNVADVHPSFILPSLWTKRGVLVACPTYERAMYPNMVHMLDIAEIKHVKNKVAGYFGSYAWSGGAQKVFEGYAEKLDWEVVGALEFIGMATEEDIQAIQQIAQQVAKKSKEG